MATPSAGRPPSGSTPKNSIATPASLMPSPRPPTSAPMARNLSRKSPASKTPASGPGHTHSVSNSSHPSMTPHLGPALGEEMPNYNSPAAMIMSSLNMHGLTPLPSGPEGLGIAADLNNIATEPQSVPEARNPEEEKLRRLQEVVKLLKTRVAGQGVCREGVERLAQQAGFTHMWQEDILAIAGTCVDLEITFDHVEKDRVSDAVLKIFGSKSEEHKKDASDVLKADLESSSQENLQRPWRNLEGFAKNLAHLGEMDHLSQGINCFEAVDGLYHAFRKIWNAEEQRRRRPGLLDRLNCGVIGRPVLNRKRKLGLSLEYWAEGRQTPDVSSAPGTDHFIQGDSSHMEIDSDDSAANLWAARIDCEAGYPSLRVSKAWVIDEVFRAADEEGSHGGKEDVTPPIGWLEPSPTLISPADATSQPNGVDTDDTGIKLPKPPEVRFVANLEPDVLVPLSVASSILSKQGLTFVLDESKFTTFDRALRDLNAQPSLSEGSDLVPPPPRWSKAVSILDDGGAPLSRSHSYRLYSMPQIWCCPLRSVTFDHPKHLVELLPTLRQYALLWTLLRSILSQQSTTTTRATSEPVKTQASLDDPSTHNSSPRWNIQRSNVDPRRAKIQKLLGGNIPNDRTPGMNDSDAASEAQQSAALAVDISLSLTPATPAKPTLDLIWPLPVAAGLSRSTPQAAVFGGVSIEIGPNGLVDVTSAAGIPDEESEKWCKAIAKVVTLSEDLGLLVEWILAKSQRHHSRM